MRKNKQTTNEDFEQQQYYYSQQFSPPYLLDSQTQPYIQDQSNKKRHAAIIIIIVILLILAAVTAVVLFIVLSQDDNSTNPTNSLTTSQMKGIQVSGTVSSKNEQEGSKSETVTGDLKLDYLVSSDNIVFGQSIIVSIQASGGSGNYQYHVSYKKKTENNWSVIQDYNSNNTVTIKPAKPVNYDILVKVKDSDGKIQELRKEFFVNDTLKITYTISSRNVSPEDQITVKLDSEGGTGRHTYAVYYVLKSQYEANPKIDWNCSQHFTENKEVTLPNLPEGEYYFCVKVMDENGVVRKSEYDTIISKKT